MKLFELFNRKVPYTVVKETENRFRTEAVIGKRLIAFFCHGAGLNPRAWEAEFIEKDPKDPYASGRVTMTGSGNEFEVMSFVRDSFEEFVKRYDPKMVEFTAAIGDKSRIAVYDRMVKKLVPGSKYQVDRTDADEMVCWAIYRKGV